MKFICLSVLCMNTLASGSFAQHQHPMPSATQIGNESYDPDKTSFPVVETALPLTRPQALARVKPTGKRVEYDLIIDEQTVNISGKPKRAMTVNGGIPGPTLRYTEGDVAVIHVHNKLKTETSIHWHGLLLPNKQDGVSYLNTPPIKAGETYTFEYPIVQSGTYWFHSHTRFQEQVGVYGSIAIQPQNRTRSGVPVARPVHQVDHDLVMLMSDWTNENSAYILKNLKRRNEWYSIKKGNAQPLNRIIQHKAVGAYLRQSMQKMAPMDISDVYYERFLINGKDTVRYPAIKPGQTVRLRIINASASTYFHVNFAGGPMTLIAADGVDVQPVDVDRRLIAIAETYDFLVTIPEGGAFELRASAQDGSGYATALLGSGPVHYAPVIPSPDLYKLTANMSRMGGMGMGTMDMGKSDHTGEANIDMNGPTNHDMTGRDHSRTDKDHSNSKKPAPGKKDDAMAETAPADRSDRGMDHSQMDMGGSKPKKPASAKAKKSASMPGMDHSQMDMKSWDMSSINMPKDGKMSMSGMNHSSMKPGDNRSGVNHNGMGSGMDGMNMMDEQNTIDYGILKATEPILFPAGRPIREIPLTLSGNMFRYIWGFNGQPMSRADVIEIRRGEIVRMKLTNNTMMMHPIHLHGHYFRVLNGQGEFSPLKHTVNVSPMGSVTIEFMADEDKDWFFHCHLLYHMLSGMARVVSYGDKPDSSIAQIQKLHLREMRDNQPFVWGFVQPGYPLNYFGLNVSNNKNAIVAGGDHDWRTNKFEFDLDYERYLGDWFRVFAGVDGGNESFLRRSPVTPDGQGAPTGDRKILRAVAGIRYMLPFLIQSEVKVDARGNVRFQLSGQQMLFPRLDLQYQTQWLIGGYLRAHVELQYTLTKNLFLHTDYDTRYRTAGGGLGYNF